MKFLSAHYQAPKSWAAVGQHCQNFCNDFLAIAKTRFFMVIFENIILTKRMLPKLLDLPKFRKCPKSFVIKAENY